MREEIRGQELDNPMNEQIVIGEPNENENGEEQVNENDDDVELEGAVGG